jgi:hypothetical protein
MTFLRTLDHLLTRSARTLRTGSKGAGRRKQDDVLDIIFIALLIGFFLVSIGYVAACDRLMK